MRGSGDGTDRRRCKTPAAASFITIAAREGHKPEWDYRLQFFRLINACSWTRSEGRVTL